MGTLTAEPFLDWLAPPTDAASLVAVFSLPLLYLGAILAARHHRRRRDR